MELIFQKRKEAVMLAEEAFDIFDLVVGSHIFSRDPELKLGVLRIAIARNHLGEKAFMPVGAFPSEAELVVHPELAEIFLELKNLLEVKYMSLATRN